MTSFLLSDLRFAWRRWRRRPAFPLVVLLITSFGVGSLSAVFSVLDSTLLRPLPYPQASRLVLVGRGLQSVALFAHWQASLRGVELLAAARPAGPMALTGEHIPARVLATEVSRELFPLLGAKAAAGRLFEPEDFTSRAERLVLSHQIWHRRWAGDPGVIGSRIKLGGRLWTITGVLSPSFVPPSRVTGEQVDIWLPLHREADDSGAWRSHSLRVIGRLGAGGTLESASADLLEVDARLAEQIPEHRTNLRGDAKFTALLPLKSATVSEVEGKLWMIWLAAAALLLIANANLAGFFLADGRERTQELKMRAVLGATSGRLLRQLLLEALVLAFLEEAWGWFSLSRARRSWWPFGQSRSLVLARQSSIFGCSFSRSR